MENDDKYRCGTVAPLAPIFKTILFFYLCFVKYFFDKAPTVTVLAVREGTYLLKVFVLMNATKDKSRLAHYVDGRALSLILEYGCIEHLRDLWLLEVGLRFAYSGLGWHWPVHAVRI